MAHGQKTKKTVKMGKTAPAHPKPMPFGRLLLISFAVFNLGYIVDQTISWSDHLQGLANGIFHVMFSGIAWCIFVLPWSLIIFAFYRWRRWERFRTHWVLAPALLAVMVSIGFLIAHPPTASNRLRTFAKADLPDRIRNLHYHFSGGGITDYSDTYYFETTPAEVDRLVLEMRLTKEAPSIRRLTVVDAGAETGPGSCFR